MAILGIDEVGRGAWAGPLVVGAAVLVRPIEGLADSKLLTKKRREELNREILDSGAGIGLGWVSASEVDEIGLSAALRRATIEAVRQVRAPYHEIIIDGTVNFLADTNRGEYVTLLKKADQLISAVSAASIVAKVARDNYMADLTAQHPNYGFADHVGYGTAAHRQAIEQFGVCAEHRLSFKPLQKYAPAAPTPQTAHSGVTTKQIGDRAEDKVAAWLESEGHIIVARNWKTRACEIDIVSEKSGTLYFTEVKYRRTSERGGGLAAITPSKQAQMAFAAESFVRSRGAGKYEIRLAAAEVAGENFSLDQYVVL
jgi:ribonuclease HII